MSVQVRCPARLTAPQQLAAMSSVSLWRPEPTPIPHSHDTPRQGPHYLEVVKAGPHQKRWGSLSQSIRWEGRIQFPY